MPYKTATKACCRIVSCTWTDGDRGLPLIRYAIFSPFVVVLLQLILIGCAMDFGEYLPWSVALIPLWVCAGLQLCVMPCIVIP